jgi:hypothetical protein
MVGETILCGFVLSHVLAPVQSGFDQPHWLRPHSGDIRALTKCGADRPMRVHPASPIDRSACHSSTSQQWLIRFLGDGRDHGLNPRLKCLNCLIVSLPNAAAATPGNDGRRSSVELAPSNAAPAIGGKNRFD